MRQHGRGGWRFVVVLLLALSVGVLVPVGPAAAEDQVYRHGVFDTAEYDGRGFNGIGGVTCDVTGYWRTNTSSGFSQIVIDAKCDLGSGANDHEVEWYTSAQNCGLFSYGPQEVELWKDNHDPPEPGTPVQFNGVMVGGGTGCGAVDELCFRHRSQGFWGDGYKDWTDEKCVSWSLGTPPSTGSGSAPVGGCTAYAPNKPWVTAPEAVAVSGGWAWRSTVTVTIPGLTAQPALSGINIQPLLVAKTTSGVTVSYTRPTPGDAATNSGGQWVIAPFYSFYPNAWTWHQSVAVTVTGPTHTTAVGADPLDWQWEGAGVLWNTGAGTSPGVSSSSTRPKLWTARPTISQLDGTTNEANTYGGHHDPALCHFWYGTNVFATDTSGYAEPAGPLDNTEPAPYVPPGGTEQPPTYPAPDPGDNTNDEPVECGGFNFDDPATWGDQATCMVVYLLWQILETTTETVVLLTDVVALLEQILAALEDGATTGGGATLADLTELLVPPEGLWDSIGDDFAAAWSGSQLDDWSTALGTVVPSSTSTNCDGPTLGPFDLIEDVQVPEMKPLQACDGAQQDAAAMVRGVLSVGVILGGAWRMWDMLVGSVGGYRGGGKHMSESEWV